MNFCIISPASGLEKYSIQSKVHLVLPQVRNRTYSSFYMKRRSKGDFIILDNGAYEEQLPTPARIQKCLEMYRPQVVVCPDSLLKKSSITIKLTKAFLDYYYDRYPADYMGVPQSEAGDLYSWWRCCKELLEDERISWIGIPRSLATHYSDNYQDLRSTIANVIKDCRPDIKLHALGMADGSLEELRRLAMTEQVESCDSSAPVWRGWNGVRLDERIVWREEGTPVDFNAKVPSSRNHALINRNLKEVLKACNLNQSGGQLTSITADSFL
jgi:hypothetical protein